VTPHAGLIARFIGGNWLGVLIEGPSGCGKSDLALRTLSAGFRLVSDDRTVVWASGGRLWGRAPAALSGLIEVRGQGISHEPAVDMARIVLVATCVAAGEAIERLPDPDYVTLEGVTLPRLKLDAREASAPAKLSRAIEHLGAARQQAYQPPPLGGRGRAGTGDTP
jgi:serine kinase of HPr protein (carbohydrate metabolism regulator)